MKYCLIGKKLGHSYSAYIHEKRGFHYALNEIPEKSVAEFFRSREYAGFNVTIPYKKFAAELSDVLSVSAEETGSVNTVKIADGVVYGYNTDIDGVNYMFKRKGVSFNGKSVLIGGTGGAAQTVCYCAKKGGARTVRLIGRSGEIDYENCCRLAADAEIFVNATPAGMFPDNFSRTVELSGFNKLTAVFDLIYNPFKTELLRQAEELGLVYSNGLPMLIEQALCAEDIWTGGFHSQSDVERLISETVFEKSNIVLCGMPSSGKTALGRLVAKISGREFIDADESFSAAFGKTPAEFIKTEGEAAFRARETEIIKKISVKTGAVISSGGGAPIKEENVSALKQNGVIVYIKRDLARLSVSGRPVSEAKGVAALYAERKNFYEKAADCSVDNDDTIERAAAEVLKAYENTCYKRR